MQYEIREMYEEERLWGRCCGNFELANEKRPVAENVV